MALLLRPSPPTPHLRLPLLRRLFSTASSRLLPLPSPAASARLLFKPRVVAAAVPWRNGVALRAFMASTAASEAMQEKRVAGEYTAANVQVLEALDGVRTRPGLYIGSTGPRGLHHLRALFDEGCIYVGVPPLYKVEHGKQVHYGYDDADLKELVNTFPANASYHIQRFKGLGEMMPVQLWETTMDPERRLLKQLRVEDAAEANVVFSSLMGTRVDYRKQLIQNASSMISLVHLDI